MQDPPKYFSTAALYCITPCEEELARRAAESIEQHSDPIPVYIPESRQLPASTPARAEIVHDVHIQRDDEQHEVVRCQQVVRTVDGNYQCKRLIESSKTLCWQHDREGRLWETDAEDVF